MRGQTAPECACKQVNQSIDNCNSCKFLSTSFESVGFIIDILNALDFTSLFEMQKAMQWWDHRRSLHLQHQIEQLRDQSLQEIFAIRRSIELIEFDQHRFDQQRQDWLTQAEQLHRSLEQISHHLSPFYIEESLPLAIQYQLDSLQFDSVRLDLPIDWLDEPPARNRIILAVLSELLHLACDRRVQSTIRVQLKAQKRLAKLAVQITYFDKKAIVDCGNNQELKYLVRSFRLLTSGWCLHRRQGQTATWHFYWQLHLSQV